jgi:hypothetical protein
MKNEFAKTRPKENPYEVWKNVRPVLEDEQAGTWTWNVLKKWQIDDNKMYARWYCFVTSPFCPDGEYGDVYVSEIKSLAIKIK